MPVGHKQHENITARAGRIEHRAIAVLLSPVNHCRWAQPQQREKQLQSLLGTPEGREELQELANRYVLLAEMGSAQSR
jgi:hypothetical protein